MLLSNLWPLVGLPVMGLPAELRPPAWVGRGMGENVPDLDCEWVGRDGGGTMGVVESNRAAGLIERGMRVMQRGLGW